MSNKSELEKIFLLTLVQNAKCYCITRQENPEFLGEFDGGAKTTSNSGVISFEYVEIWERYARYVSSLTNKQTKWMKCPVIGNQIQRGKNLKFALNRYIADMKEGEKERKKITSFLSIWVISSKSKYKKNESKTDQINEEKLEIYRSNTGKGKERIGERLRDFQQIQVKFYQLFATVLRWSLEKFEEKIYKYIVRLTGGRRKERKRKA